MAVFVCDKEAAYYTLERLCIVDGPIMVWREVTALARAQSEQWGADEVVQVSIAEGDDLTTADNIVWNASFCQVVRKLAPETVQELLAARSGEMYVNGGGVCFPYRRGTRLPWTVKTLQNDTYVFEWTDKAFATTRTVRTVDGGKVLDDKTRHGLFPIIPRPLSLFVQK